jgi:hypothetical protein
MLISARHLVDRMRYPRTRADELASLRARFAAQPARWQATREQRETAERLRELRALMSRALTEVDSCGRCAKGHPLPAGRWDGGHCCGGRTLDIFAPEEVAALKLGGTDAAKLHTPAGDHAGCVFRGETGCSLSPEDRPTLCVRYICPDLRSELRQTAAWTRVAELARALRDTHRRLVELSREESQQNELW